MDVFITWSGEASLILAEGLRRFLKRTIQRLQPFLSSEDIRKGQRWPEQIGLRLSNAKYAILCLTKDNLDGRWIHFEAGAVSKDSQAGVTAILLDVEYTDVKWPLAQFQHTVPTQPDLLNLMRAIN